MAKKSQFVLVGKRQLELSNLEKILYPEDHIVKAEIIDQYYNLGPQELVDVIQEKLPLSSADKRCNKGNASKLIASIHDSIEKLQTCKDSLTDEDRGSLLELIKMLSSL